MFPPIGEFYKAVEEDAHERAERRKEREKAGKELKKKGTEAFRREEFEEAADLYSRAIKETPWDISLYTNMALVSVILLSSELPTLVGSGRPHPPLRFGHAH